MTPRHFSVCMDCGWSRASANDDELVSAALDHEDVTGHDCLTDIARRAA